MKIEYKSIGIVHTPFKDLKNIPNQPSLAEGTKGVVEVYPTFQKGLKDPDGSSVVRLNEIHENRLMISDLDILDGTPVLDIKPYFRELESDVYIKTGWLEKRKLQND